MTPDADGLPVVLRLKDLKENIATFTKIGQAEYSPLERLAKSSVALRRGGYDNYRNTGWSGQILLHDQRVYVITHGDVVNGVLVYDVHDPTRPREVGHFATPDDVISSVAPLPNGRVLLTGYRLYILAPPRSAG